MLKKQHLAVRLAYARHFIKSGDRMRVLAECSVVCGRVVGLVWGMIMGVFRTSKSSGATDSWSVRRGCTLRLFIRNYAVQLRRMWSMMRTDAAQAKCLYDCA